jgi:tRNA-modifying protein YgfZ
MEPTVPLIAPDNLALIEVTGTDRISHLEAVTSQRLADARPGEVRGAMILDAHGAPLAMFWVVVHAERLALLAPPTAATHILEVTATRTFLADIAFTPTEAAVWALRGDGIDDALAEVGVAGLPPGNWRPVGDGLVVRHAFGAEVVGDDLAARLAFLDDVQEGDAQALDAARVTVGEPMFGREVAAGRLPEELGLLATHVHLAKGCYPGQEAVARMWMLGRPRRRLAQVAVDGDMDPGWTAGSGRDRVEVTAIGGTQALAFVPANAEVGDTYDQDGASVTITAFVGGNGMPPGHDPNVTRRRDRTA